MRYALLLMMFLWASSARAGALHVYGPGGPAPAMKEAAATFAKARNIQVEVTAGPTLTGRHWRTRMRTSSSAARNP